MNKYDYITATTLEEKVRLEKLIKYMEDNNIEDNLLEYKERYNNICKYLVAKDKYLNIEKDIDDIKIKLDELYKKKDEYEVDNLLLEETLISKFNTDTNGKYRNILYEDIKLIDDKEIRDILYILFEKESEYSKLLSKRNKLKNIIDKDKYPNTYDTLLNQDILIEKQDELLDNIFLLENNIKIEREKQRKIEDSAMTIPILKILYEFWIIDSYDPSKVNRNKLFEDNKTLVNYNETLNELSYLYETNISRSIVSSLISNYIDNPKDWTINYQIVDGTAGNDLVHSSNTLKDYVTYPNYDMVNEAKLKIKEVLK